MSAISSSLSAGLSGVDFSSKVSVQVAKMTLDQAKQQGDALVQLLKASADVATNCQDCGGGGRLDVSA